MKPTHPRGSALLHALLILSIVISAATGTFLVLHKQIIQTTNFAQGVRAFYAAESGTEQLLYEMRKQGKTAGNLTGTRDLANNTAWQSSSEVGLSDFMLSLARDEIFELPLQYPDDQLTHVDVNTVNISQSRGPLEITVIVWSIQDPKIYGMEKLLLEGSSYGLDLTTLNFNGAPIRNVSHSSRNYRIRLRALDKANSFRVVSAPSPIPHLIRLKSVGTSPKSALTRYSKQAIEVVFNSAASVPTLFDFVLFSYGDIKKSNSAQRWIKTEDGDVHAKSNLDGGVAQGGAYNATYLITAGGGAIDNFTSSQMQGKQRQNYQISDYVLTKPEVDFFAANAVPLPADFGHDGKLRLNGYIYTITTAALDFATPGVRDDVVIIEPNAGEAGYGIFYRQGNLQIMDNIYIDDTRVGTDMTGLPVAVFIVEGDITFDAGVTHVDGFFYVTGTVKTSAGSEPLTIRGAVVAGGFNLQRNTNDNNAEEIFIYDPRLFINPPPGFLR